MQSSLEVQKINSLLSKARIFNRNIGIYMVHKMDDLDYIVHLTNGKIYFKSEDFEQDAAKSFTAERLHEIAGRFEGRKQPRDTSLQQGRSWTELVVAGSIFISILIAGFALLKLWSPEKLPAERHSLDWMAIASTHEDLYAEKLVAAQRQKETAHILRYLTTDIQWNALKDGVSIHGKIHNLAHETGIVKLKMKLSLHSSSGALVYEEIFYIDKFIAPQQVIDFNHEASGFYGKAAKADWEVVEATCY